MTSWLHRQDPSASTAVIGEVGQAHEGSLGLAHNFIDAVADAGCDAVKFQTHIAAEESTPEEPWRVKFSTQDERRYDYWQRMEFTKPQWAELKAHADERGLLFLSSPFSLAAVELLKEVGVAAWKIASGEITNGQMLRAIAETGQPAILSTGMSDFPEIDQAVEVLGAQGSAVAVLQCTSEYPCALEQVGLNNVALLAERYGVAGLSDHSGTAWPSLAAVAEGAKVIEVHVTLSPRLFGPDVPASLTVEGLTQLVEGVRAFETLKANPVDKTAKAQEMARMRSIFMKKAVLRADLAAGSVLTLEHLALKKTAPVEQGTAVTDLDAVVGRKLSRDLKAGAVLLEEDVH